MRKKIYYFKLRIFLLGFSVLLTNCFKEIPPDTIEQSGIVVKRVNFQELKQKRNLYNKIEQIDKVFDFRKRDSQLKEIKSTNDSFTILTNEILQVNTDSTEAFTFRVETPTHSNSAFENFVIEKRNDGNYSFYIYRYVRVEYGKLFKNNYSIYKEQVNEEQIVSEDFQSLIDKTTIYQDENGCVYEWWYDNDCDCEYTHIIWCPENNDDGGGSGNNNENDGNNDGGNNDGGGNDGGGNDGDSGNIGGNGGYNEGSDGTSSGNNGDSTFGILPNPLNTAIDNFFNNLSDVEEACINSNPSLKGKVGNFLEQNLQIEITSNDSSSIQNTNVESFAHLAIDAECSGGSVNYEERIIFSPSFESNSKAKCIYNTLILKSSIRDLLDDALGEASNFTITYNLLDMGSGPTAAAGSTHIDLDPTHPNNVIVNLNTNHFIDGVDNLHPISNAQTIIHESIHAFFKIKAKNCQGVNIPIYELNELNMGELLNIFDYNCVSNAINEHNLMYNSLIPVMNNMLNEVFDDLVAFEDVNPDIIFQLPLESGIDPPIINHPFIWEEALYYLSLQGLQHANEFTSTTDTMTNPIAAENLFQMIYTKVNFDYPFNKETCDE